MVHGAKWWCGSGGVERTKNQVGVGHGKQIKRKKKQTGKVNLVLICQKGNIMIKQVLLTMLFVCVDRAIVGYVLIEVFMT